MKPQELNIGLVLPDGMAPGDLPSSPSVKSRPTVMKYQSARYLINGMSPGELLANRIRDEASVQANILKVNSFLNHQVDTHLMSVCGHGETFLS
ncbi:hypothetical protein T492DRAFT_3703 [Pavlovales sp. CCMP2436]|nr:hypothetical protein T492DRAFT_3703 [Pavlovales sp. CCMP2436]